MEVLMDDMMKCSHEDCGMDIAGGKEGMMAHWNEAHAGDPMPAEANATPADDMSAAAPATDDAAMPADDATPDATV